MMTSRTETALRCPRCGNRAWALVDWFDERGTPHGEVREYRCPRGCQIDPETVREIIGAP